MMKKISFFLMSLIHAVFVFQAITKELFDEALRSLADEDVLTVTGKTIRLLA